MLIELSERQKDALRTIVKLIRDENLDEEFFIVHDISGNAHLYAKRNDVDFDQTTHWVIPRLTNLTIEALTQAGYIFSMVKTESRSSEFASTVTTSTSQRSRRGCVTPSGFRAVDSNFMPVEDLVMHRAPVEISSSLSRFRSDFPDPTRLAFVMMQFGKSKAHESILGAVRLALQGHGFIALRADDKEYHDDLYFNILTYIYGCRFGIAIFERIEDNAFNPNVSLEVGYMNGIGKSVCYLKDKSLPSLQSDLMGKLYRSFDPFEPQHTIEDALNRWMRDRGFIAALVSNQNKASDLAS